MSDKTLDTIETLIIGHKNPDTDSICSAIAYADLKSRTEEGCFVPCRAGELSSETKWVLRRFGLAQPRLIEDVSPQVRDTEIRRIQGVSGELTVREAWSIMRDKDISTLPLTDAEGHLEGIVSLRDLAISQMDSLDTHELAKAETPYRCIAETLEGSVVVGDRNAVMRDGYIFVGAGDPEAIRAAIHPGDLMLVSNRVGAQRTAIECGAGCIVVCLDSGISPEIHTLAMERGCVVITTPFDTYKAAYFINQSVPVRHYMVAGGLKTFSLSTPLEDVLQVMGKTRFKYFPILDDDGLFYGVLSRRNILNRNRKRMILVDHNEKSQCVSGWEEAEIREIVDHHRVGGISTVSPIFFRNQPVGSTATIVWMMYRERGISIPADIAGAMCCAVLSDTLLFRSPTCTETDRQAAAELAALAGENAETLADAMFEAGEDLEGKTAEEVLTQDYKVFTSGSRQIGIAQSMFYSASNRKKAMELTRPLLAGLRRDDALTCMYYLLTDIRTETSYVLMEGENARDILLEAFPGAEGADTVTLPGVVSRKKQFVPAVIAAMQTVLE